MQLIGIQAGERFAGYFGRVGAREDGDKCFAIDAESKQTDSLQQSDGRFVVFQHRLAITLGYPGKANALFEHGSLVVIRFLLRLCLQLFRRAKVQRCCRVALAVLFDVAAGKVDRKCMSAALLDDRRELQFAAADSTISEELHSGRQVDLFDCDRVEELRSRVSKIGQRKT